MTRLPLSGAQWRFLLRPKSQSLLPGCHGSYAPRPLSSHELRIGSWNQRYQSTWLSRSETNIECSRSCFVRKPEGLAAKQRWRRFSGTGRRKLSKSKDEIPRPPPLVPSQPDISAPLTSAKGRIDQIKHENIYTIPNFLTFTRILCAPAVGYLILHDHHTAALGLFVYAGVTDLVDGWIARKWNSGTVVGSVIDPMADKALMTIVTVVLAVKEILPLPLAVIILGRDVLLSLSAIYYRYISLPPPRTLARYWDFSLPSAEVKPTNISKINTFLQLALIGVTMGGTALGGESGDLATGLGETGMNVLEASWWIVGGTTIWSGLSYVGGRKGLRIISQSSKK